MYQIHCMNNIAKVGTDRLGAGYELVDELAGADGILVRSANLHEVALPESLLAIARAGAGVNNIPVDACAEAGIVVFNTPGANANAVKELVLCGMLLSCRNIIGGNEWVRANAADPAIGKSAEQAKKQFGGFELAGKTVGVIGLGAIGAKVADALLELDATVLGYDPFLSVSAAWDLDRRIVHMTDLNELLERCDFVTLHVPATADTRGMISAEAIGHMKPECVLINFARDVLVDEAALSTALEERRVRRYITDFANPVTAHMEHAIVLPHLGASTAEAEVNCAVMAVNELKDYLENGNIVNSVNYPHADLGKLTEGARVAIFHENVKGAINRISHVTSESDLNIEKMVNVSRGQNAYTLLDVTGEVADSLVETLRAIPGVRRVRVIAAA